MESRAYAKEITGVVSRTYRRGGIEEIHVRIETEEAQQAMGKPMGEYVTLCHPGILHAETNERRMLARAVGDAVKRLLPPFGDVMVVGLGNRHVTADALGSRVVESLMVTRHMKDGMPGDLQGRLRGVCAIAPGVLGITGMETAEIVKGTVEKARPAAVIAIDALAARESGRICTTVQITDTGIQPGSGVGNHRRGLTRETLGVPVIAVGVPMVVYASVIARDALTLLLSDMGLSEREHAPALEALTDKVVKTGLGELVVTPREVDELVGKVAKILADGLNMALQPRLSEEEIQTLTHDGM